MLTYVLFKEYGHVLVGEILVLEAAK